MLTSVKTYSGQKAQMKLHLLRHQGEEVKKYPCSECCMSFLTNSKNCWFKFTLQSIKTYLTYSR